MKNNYRDDVDFKNISERVKKEFKLETLKKFKTKVDKNKSKPQKKAETKKK